ncbi:MAG: hypothetical protein J6C75_03000 [Oscillospiraceae bacterium]|nr:hypothetical protein [Oscillospiraceae bacterium]
MQRNSVHQNKNPVMQSKVQMSCTEGLIVFPEGKLMRIGKSAYHPLFGTYYRLLKAYHRPFRGDDIGLLAGDAIIRRKRQMSRFLRHITA